METLSIIALCLAILIDNALYSVIVPIIPVYLQKLDHPPSSMNFGEVVNNDTSTIICCADDVVNNTSTTSYHEHLKIGILFGSKAITEILFTFISGPIIDRIGCRIPMMAGTVNPRRFNNRIRIRGIVYSTGIGSEHSRNRIGINDRIGILTACK